MIGNKHYNYIDLTTLICVVLLMSISVLVVYSASTSWAMQKFGESEKLLTSHVLKIFLALIALFVGMNINYQIYKKHTRSILIFSAALLLVTLIFGGEVKGSIRFLRFSGFGLQPSEIAKFALIFHICALISIKGDYMRNFSKGFLPILIWIFSIVVLVLLQPNFSTASMIIFISFIMMFIGGVRLKHLAFTLAPVVPILGMYMLLASYRMARVEAFINNLKALILIDSESIRESSYQLWQGIIGFGTGGIFGVGIGNSKQRDLFLPEAYSDFIFSIVGEEYGLFGTVILMFLFFLIFFRGFKIAKYSIDPFGKNLAIGITMVIISYALINAGVTLGLLPTTGLTMPFVSYGGTSILLSGFTIGVLLNISKQTDLHPKPKKIPVVGTVSADN